MKPTVKRRAQPNPNWLPAFRYFLSLIKVKSKEMEEPGPITLYTSQEMLLEEIDKALKAGIHYIVVLKARQLGISTVLMALDLFWLYMHPGLQGAFVCDTGENREVFRETFTDMMESLPAGFKIPTKVHNRVALVLEGADGSRLQYMSAGKGRNSGLGRSRALNFLHATELSSWGDEKGYETLDDTLALTNRNRLFVFESTALGYNMFFDCWNDALANPTQRRAVFIGWWAKEVYSLEEDSEEFAQWWGAYPQYTPYEAKVTLEVYQQYGIEISPSQWAWYRAKADGRSEQHMMEEYPSLPQEAFQASGSPFFNPKKVNTDIEFITTNQVGFSGYTYELGDNFLKMKMRRTMDVDEATLRVWAPPSPTGRYVIGVDPAFGSSEEADSTVITVWRCFADKLVQVAEYASPITTTQNCAWVTAHLAGEYRDCIVNVELQGGGDAVMMEFKHLKQSIQFGYLNQAARVMSVEHVLDSARWFLWRKPDTMTGIPTAYNTKSNQNSKLTGLQLFRDAYNTNQLIARSVPLLREMATMKREGDKIAASGRNKDDRVMAGVMAVYAWKDWIQSGMMSDHRTEEREMQDEAMRKGQSNNVLTQIIPSFMKEKADLREALELQRLLENPLP